MADCPEEAGASGRSAPTRTYTTDALTVEWRAERCIHTGHCLAALPEVFDNTARPWMDLEGADTFAVAEAVRRCPTGALRYSGEDLPPDDGADHPVSIEAQRNGPLYVRGAVEVTDHEDRPITAEPRVALCRCGNTENAPFCDNGHQRMGWQEPA